MSKRIPTPPPVQSLFCNIPIESGLTDSELVLSVKPRVAHKTFSRFRIAPPASITSDHLLMVARLTQHLIGIDAADVIALARDPDRHRDHRLRLIVMPEVFPRSKKELAEAARRTAVFASTARRIYLFDRGNSFGYLVPVLGSEIPPDGSGQFPPVKIDSSRWAPETPPLHYDCRPRVSVILAQQSLAIRYAHAGDAAIEQLIENVECGEHSLTVVNDALRLAHRVFRGAFDGIQAATIFDRRAMLLLPEHGRCVRLYDSHRSDAEARLIAESIRLLLRMRRFRIHEPTRSGIVAFLRGLRSYRSPRW